MTKQTKIVLATATVLLTGSALLMIYSSDAAKKRANAAVNNPADAISIINVINQQNGLPIIQN